MHIDDRIAAKAQALNKVSGNASSLAPLAWLAPILIFLTVFFVGPLLVNIGQSLGAGGSSLSSYERLLTDAYYLSVVVDTISLGLFVTAACVAIGYPLSLVIARADGIWKVLLIFAVVAPLLVNVVVRSFGWMVLFSGAGAINWALASLGLGSVDLMYTWTGVAIALVHVLLPFMVLSITSTLETLDSSLEEAAQVLGAGHFDTFRLVVLPLSFEGMMTGSILVFTATVGSFVTVMLLGSTSTAVLPLLIYQQLTVASDWPFAATMGMVLLVIITGVLWLQSRYVRPRWRH